MNIILPYHSTFISWEEPARVLIPIHCACANCDNYLRAIIISLARREVCCEYYQRANIIQGWNLFAEIRYTCMYTTVWWVSVCVCVCVCVCAYWKGSCQQYSRLHHLYYEYLWLSPWISYLCYSLTGNLPKFKAWTTWLWSRLKCAIMSYHVYIFHSQCGVCDHNGLSCS